MKTAHHLVATFILTFLIVSTITAEAQFNCITNNGTITITGYTGPGGDVSIPSEINGLPVTTIDDGYLEAAMVPPEKSGMGMGRLQGVA